MRLQDVNAVITGVSSGIGQAVAAHFRREGANLLLPGRRPELPESHPDDLYLAGDSTTRPSSPSSPPEQQITTPAGAASISLDAYSKVSRRAVRAGLLGVPIRRSWELEKMEIS
ncbi:hypothetical protein [Streptomyces umbrinus]|uniref:hypothetical protein n=1 Tax=Streptomyces umbrinus TaxID=67370 RepID=UPI003C2B469B